jgi:aminoglycoside phosphotransferase (APT) family kinase protein
MPLAMHADELTVGIQTVRDLVSHQFPQWARLPITGFASQGTVNALFRMGDQLAARFPLQPAGVDETRRWLESEAEAARELLGRTPFATPEPVAIRRPGSRLSPSLVGSNVAAWNDRHRDRPGQLDGIR